LGARIREKGAWGVGCKVGVAWTMVIAWERVQKIAILASFAFNTAKRKGGQKAQPLAQR